MPKLLLASENERHTLALRLNFSSVLKGGKQNSSRRKASGYITNQLVGALESLGHSVLDLAEYFVLSK